MIQRMSDNNEIVFRYMVDPEFQDSIFLLLAKELYEKINSRKGM